MPIVTALQPLSLRYAGKSEPAANLPNAGDLGGLVNARSMRCAVAQLSCRWSSAARFYGRR